jgi:hypothetical protein
VYEVQLNFGGSGTTLAEQTAININHSSLNFSNFIIVDQRIYFAIGSTIIVLDILDSTRTQQYSELPECPQVYKLVAVGAGSGDQQIQLQAYCIDKYILYDPVYGDWTSIYPFSSNGVPYLYPDNNYRATFFTNGTLQFSERGLLLNTINNANISNGICFESHNRTYFAYSAADQQHYNVCVYDFITQNHYPVSPYFCLQECPQLFILDDQYLIIRDSDRDSILDTKTNFSLIINISNGIADILAILHGNISAITPSPPIIPSTTTESASSSMNNTIVVTSTSISTPNYTHAPNPSPSVTVHTSSASTTTTASPGIIIHNYYVRIVASLAIAMYIYCTPSFPRGEFKEH